MIEKIISSIVLDRTCSVCGGVRKYRATPRSTKVEVVECKACNGKGYLSDCFNTTALLTPHVHLIPMGVAMSMKQQNIMLVNTNDGVDIVARNLAGARFKRIYSFCVEHDDPVMKYVRSRLTEKPAEIHMYFD